MSSPHQAPTGGPAPAPSGAPAARAAQAVHTGSSASPHTGPNTHTVNTMQAGSSESAAAPAQASRPEQASHPEKAAVIFSGGQDSTTCLFLALRDFGRDNLEVITFQYGQRHAIELEKARWIAQDLGVKQTVIDTSVIRAITHNALLDGSVPIEQHGSEPPNTFVDGRNALFLLYAAIYAKGQGIHTLYTGVCETDFSGYPDCRDVFIKSMNVTLNLAMDYPFDIRTPLMWLTKKQTWALADELGAFDYIREHTHTCYLGVPGGCHECPSCVLRERGLKEYLAERNHTPAAGHMSATRHGSSSHGSAPDPAPPPATAASATPHDPVSHDVPRSGAPS